MSTTVERFDVAIAGAGPAGSSLAIRLAAKGRKVFLAEQKTFPREKLCGEFISPECVSLLNEVGVSEKLLVLGPAQITETHFFASNGSRTVIPSSWFRGKGAAAMGLSRARFDDQLLQRCRDVGVAVNEDFTATGVLLEGSAVGGLRGKCSDGRSIEVSAALTVDATGRGRSLHRFAGVDTKRSRAKHVAFKTHLSGAGIAPNACEIYSYPNGYGGCSPIEGGLFDLCFIVASEDAKTWKGDEWELARNVVSKNMRATEVLSAAKVEKPWLAVPIERFGRGKASPAPGLIAVGDSAGFIDPFTGSGILMALQSSRLAAEAVEACGTDGAISRTYEKAYSRCFGRRLRAASLLRHAAFSERAARTFIRLLSASDAISRRFALATRL